MRREDRAISREDALKILEGGEYGVLSLASEDKKPYAIPMSYAFKDNTIYLHCAIEGKKLGIIEKNGSVVFLVVGKTELLPSKFSTKYESVVAFGKASIVDDLEEKKKGLVLLIEKYSPEYMNEGLKCIDAAIDRTKVIKIVVENFTGKGRR